MLNWLIEEDSPRLRSAVTSDSKKSLFWLRRKKVYYLEESLAEIRCLPKTHQSSFIHKFSHYLMQTLERIARVLASRNSHLMGGLEREQRTRIQRVKHN